MSLGLEIKDSDAFFNARRDFWKESKERALPEKKQEKTYGQKSHESWEYPNTHAEPAVAVSGG